MRARPKSYLPEDMEDVFLQNNEMHIWIIEEYGKKRIFDIANGRGLLRESYDEITFVEHDWAILMVKATNKVAFLDKNLNLFNNTWYDNVTKDKCYLGYVVEKDGKYSILQYSTGYQSQWYDEIDKFIVDGYTKAFMKKENRWGIISADGNVVYEPIFDDWKYLCEYEDIGFAVKKDGLWTVLSSDCKLLTAFDYSEVRYNELSTVAVCAGDLWGLINLEDEWLFRLQFKSIQRFKRNGTAWVQTLNNKFALIKSDGTFLCGDRFDDVDKYCASPFICVGKYVGSRNARMAYAYISAKGKRVTDFCFSSLVTYRGDYTKNTDLYGNEVFVKDYFKF